MHVKVDMVGPARYDPKGEREAFQGAIADKPSGILISPAEPNLMAADIDSALQQGIPVLTIDSDAPTSKRPFYIGSNNYATGRLGGQFLVKLLGGKGNVVMFTYPKQANLMERQQGYQSGSRIIRTFRLSKRSISKEIQLLRTIQQNSCSPRRRRLTLSYA